jgi:hypothetical protein
MLRTTKSRQINWPHACQHCDKPPAPRYHLDDDLSPPPPRKKDALSEQRRILVESDPLKRKTAKEERGETYVADKRVNSDETVDWKSEKQ